MRSETATIVISQRTILAEGIVAILERGGYEVLQHVERGSDIKLPRFMEPQGLLLIILREGNIDQESTCRELAAVREAFPESRIVLIRRDPAFLSPESVFLSDANAFVLGIFSGGQILSILKMVLASPMKLYIASGTREMCVTDASAEDHIIPLSKDEDNTSLLSRLSRREREILDALAKGNSNKHLARLFNLSEATVKAHVRSIFSKLGADNRTKAALHLVGSAEIAPRSRLDDYTSRAWHEKAPQS
ncbi:response regulator transcription factor [Sphingomonas bacterium]|uniref:response regulator transcription factor n=1 Tax=Sphingomonas bacterium TaxID=1895847 RepID=UPI00157536FD|nr:LuxR C-terminal-related transcriptional regulator [Sphingomonas bacterium]